jgi:hypothetical protein
MYVWLSQADSSHEVFRLKFSTNSSFQQACYMYRYFISLGRLGGVMVSVLATGPKIHGFKPGRDYGFLGR